METYEDEKDEMDEVEEKHVKIKQESARKKEKD